MRNWVLKHWRITQALFVLLALGLTVLVTARIVRPKRRVASPSHVATKSPLDSLLEAIKLSGNTWDEKAGPDGSRLSLQTKCAAGSVSYIFRATITPKFSAHYRRTFGNGNRFELALLDSGGFKLANIPISPTQLINRDSAGVIVQLEAKDLIALSCDEYLKLQDWDPTWILAD